MSIKTQLILAGIFLTIGILSQIFFAVVAYEKYKHENICSKCKLEIRNEKGRKRMIEATWNIELNCTCPHCGQDIDILNGPEIWEWLGNLKIGETKENVEAYCPKCGEELILNVGY